MRTRKTVPILLVALCGLAVAAGADDRRELREAFAWSAGQRVLIEFPVGALRVEATSGERVEIEVEAECRWTRRRCEDRLERVRIVSRATDGRLRVEVDADGPWMNSKLELEAVVRVPRRAPLEIDMSVGELEVEGLASDLSIELGVGEVSVWMSESVVRSVSLDAGIGEAELHGPGSRVRDRRTLLIGNEVRWDEGQGEARLDVELGVGEISVFLD